MNAMLCGAADLQSTILKDFVTVCIEMGLNPLSYLDGTIYYQNYGDSIWEKNSKTTIEHSHLIVFVIEEKYGEITWNVEFDSAHANGKNMLFLCKSDLFRKLRLSPTALTKQHPTEDANEIRLLFNLKKLENEYEITIIPYDHTTFKSVLREHIKHILREGLLALEVQNRKSKFLPTLLSSKFNDNPTLYINNNHTEIAKNLLFDFFEKKEIRKRAMEYFFVSKTLNDDEIIDLCLDSEQGVSRKAIQHVADLLSENSDLDLIFSEVISSLSNEDIGVIRRAIISFINIDVKLSIKHFINFFPTNDVGVPRRIVTNLYEHKNTIIAKIKDDKEFFLQAEKLITISKNYNSDTTPWKKQADELIALIKGSATSDT